MSSKKRATAEEEEDVVEGGEVEEVQVVGKKKKEHRNKKNDQDVEISKDDKHKKEKKEKKKQRHSEGGEADEVNTLSTTTKASSSSLSIDGKLLTAKERRNLFNKTRREIQKQKRAGVVPNEETLQKFREIAAVAAETREQRIAQAKVEEAKRQETKRQRAEEKKQRHEMRLAEVAELSEAKRQKRKEEVKAKKEENKKNKSESTPSENVKVKVFNASIAEFGRKKHLDKAIDAYKELLAAGLAPTVYTLTNLVNACVRCGELEEAQKFIEQFAERGVSPNEVTYTALMKGFTQHDAPASHLHALRLLEEMQTAGVPPNIRTFNTLLRGCFRAGRHDSALAILEKMKGAGISPDVFSYDYVIRTLCIAGELATAWKLEEEMSKNWKHAAIYGTLAIASALAGDPDLVRRAVHGSENGDVTLDMYHETNTEKNSASLFQKVREEELKSEVTRAQTFVASSDRVPRQFSSSDRVKFLNEAQVIDFAEIFGNNNPVKMEICSGNGEWIVERAAKDNNVNWVAVEMRVERQWSAWARVEFKKLHNVLLLVGEANFILKRCIEKESLQEVFVNFPDPPGWEGSKHNLLCKSFYRKCHKVLAPDSTLVIVTDDEVYAKSALAELEASVKYFASTLGKRGFTNVVPDSYGSSYFDRFWQKGEKNQRWFIRWKRQEKTREEK